jgi:hypothetical protein
VLGIFLVAFCEKSWEHNVSTSPPESAQSSIQIVGNEQAPFIYCDGVSAYGTQNGTIQIELAARTMLPAADSRNVTNEFVATAHLRCSPAAAAAMKDAIEKALKMFAQTTQGGPLREPPRPERGHLN